MSKKTKPVAVKIPEKLTPAQRNYLMERIDELATDCIRKRNDGVCKRRGDATAARDQCVAEWKASITDQRLLTLAKNQLRAAEDLNTPDSRVQRERLRERLFAALFTGDEIFALSGADKVAVPRYISRVSDAEEITALKDEIMLGKGDTTLADVEQRIAAIFAAL